MYGDYAGKSCKRLIDDGRLEIFQNRGGPVSLAPIFFSLAVLRTWRETFG
jgi:hypothetical protein